MPALNTLLHHVFAHQTDEGVGPYGSGATVIWESQTSASVKLENCLFQPCQIFALHLPRGETYDSKGKLAHVKGEAQSDVQCRIDAENPELSAYFAFKCYYPKKQFVFKVNSYLILLRSIFLWKRSNLNKIFSPDNPGIIIYTVVR